MEIPGDAFVVFATYICQFRHQIFPAWKIHPTPDPGATNKTERGSETNFAIILPSSSDVIVRNRIIETVEKMRVEKDW